MTQQIKFTDDPELVTAEQHTLDNVGHVVSVKSEITADAGGPWLVLRQYCTNCDWWNEEAFPYTASN